MSNELKVGQRWAKEDRTVLIREIEMLENGDVWVQYGEYGKDRTYETDLHTFQTRYSLTD